MSAKDLYTTLKNYNQSAVYDHFNTQHTPPFISYHGAGQNSMSADDTRYWFQNQYVVDYYYDVKNETQETNFEEYLLADGWRFTKSEDIYIESEQVYVIYYYVNGRTLQRSK